MEEFELQTPRYHALLKVIVCVCVCVCVISLFPFSFQIFFVTDKIRNFQIKKIIVSSS